MTCDFPRCGILTSGDSDEPVQPPFKLRNSTDVRSVALESLNIQMTSKGSDQTARMRRLVLAFAGHIYQIVGNLKWILISIFVMLCEPLL